MQTLIIEDEKNAVSNLKSILADVAPECEIVGVTDSVVESVKWLLENPMPELIFMDIHLADGSSFEIFEHIRITCPIIFTTAYDEYALKAFKVNSIDYLLKPIGEKDIKRAIDKLSLLNTAGQNKSQSITELVELMNKQKQYRNYFLIPSKNSKLIPMSTTSIACFYIDNGVVKVVSKDNDSFIISYTLDELIDCLDPKSFFRANRQYIIAKDAVLDIDYWFSGRLAINLMAPKDTKDRIVITKARVNEFKKWFSE